MEIAHDLISHDLAVDVGFAPREENKWSDALANGNASGFDPSLRYDLDLSDDESWHVLPGAIKLGIDMGMYLGRKRKGSITTPSVKDLAA